MGRSTNASGLRPLVAALHRRLTKDLRFGMAVLHLKNPLDVTTWKLVGLDSLASLLVGSSLQSFIGLPIIERHSLTTSPDLSATYLKIHTSGKALRLGHIRPRMKLGVRQYYSVTAIPLPRNRLGLLFENETFLRNTTRELLSVTTRMGEMSRTVKAIVWRANPKTLEFTTVSQEATDILGYWPERWKHETCFLMKRTHPDDWDMLQQQLAQVTEDGMARRFDCRMIAADGRTLWLHVAVHLNRLSGGATELFGVMTDITERKHIEEASRNLAMQVLRQNETQRKWLGQELDDGLGLHLSVLKANLASLQNSESPFGIETQQKLQDCAELVQTCMDDVCSVSFMLRPPLLDDCGLLAALEWYTGIFSRWSGVEIDFEVPEQLNRFDAGTEIVLFRFAQECIRNVYLHARVSRTALRLRQDEKEIVMEVEDPGVGIPEEILKRLESGSYTDGIGLTKLRELVRELSGTMQIHTGKMGTIVCARVPRQAPAPSLEATPQASRQSGD